MPQAEKEKIVVRDFYELKPEEQKIILDFVHHSGHQIDKNGKERENQAYDQKNKVGEINGIHLIEGKPYIHEPKAGTAADEHTAASIVALAAWQAKLDGKIKDDGTEGEGERSVLQKYVNAYLETRSAQSGKVKENCALYEEGAGQGMIARSINHFLSREKGGFHTK